MTSILCIFTNKQSSRDMEILNSKYIIKCSASEINIFRQLWWSSWCQEEDRSKAVLRWVFWRICMGKNHLHFGLKMHCKAWHLYYVKYYHFRGELHYRVTANSSALHYYFCNALLPTLLTTQHSFWREMQILKLPTVHKLSKYFFFQFFPTWTIRMQFPDKIITHHHCCCFHTAVFWLDELSQ